MTGRAGFLVVKDRPEVVVPQNPRYRGLDRTPPFSIEALERGFEDPLVFGDFTNDTDLIRNLDLARQVRTRFAEVEDPDTLEIVFATDDAEADASVDPTWAFLGYDVADRGGHFYSIVGNMAFEPVATTFQDRLNEHGLFGDACDAAAYLAAFRAARFPDYDASYVIWAVYLVEPARREAVGAVARPGHGEADLH